MTKITAKRIVRETGLAGIGQGPRGYDIKIDGVEVAVVAAKRNGLAFEWLGWEFIIYDGNLTPNRLRGSTLFPMTDEGLEAAKVACMSVVRKLANEKATVKTTKAILTDPLNADVQMLDWKGSISVPTGMYIILSGPFATRSTAKKAITDTVSQRAVKAAEGEYYIIVL